MSLATGENAVVDDIFSYQLYNRIKNHWRAAAAPANIQPGMFFSDSDDDRLYHAGAASALEEVLQLTRSKAVFPQFAGLRLMDTDASHYLTLKWNEDRAAHQTLNIITGALDRTLTLSGNPTLADWFDQSVKAASSPVFVTVKLSALTDGYIPYHVSDASGLANSPIQTDGTNVSIGTTPDSLLHILSANTGITPGASIGAFIIDNPSGVANSLREIVFKGQGTNDTMGAIAMLNTASDATGAQGDIAFYGKSSLITQTLTEYMRIKSGGAVVIGDPTPQANYELTVHNDIYAVGDVSALTFTDRTDFFEGDALAAILGIKGKGGKLDHASLPAFAQAHRKSNIEKEQTVTKTRQKTVKVIKQISSEEVKLINEKYTKIVTIKSQEIDEPVFKEFDLYDEKGKKIIDKEGKVVKHKVPIMEEYQVTEKVKIGEEDIVYRNLGNMVSLLTVGVQELDVRLSALEARA